MASLQTIFSFAEQASTSWPFSIGRICVVMWFFLLSRFLWWKSPTARTDGSLFAPPSLFWLALMVYAYTELYVLPDKESANLDRTTCWLDDVFCGRFTRIYLSPPFFFNLTRVHRPCADRRVVGRDAVCQVFEHCWRQYRVITKISVRKLPNGYRD